MNVLSLFDGISCSRIALENLGIKIDNYFCSEIEESCIDISRKEGLLYQKQTILYKENLFKSI